MRKLYLLALVPLVSCKMFAGAGMVRPHSSDHQHSLEPGRVYTIGVEDHNTGLMLLHGEYTRERSSVNSDTALIFIRPNTKVKEYELFLRPAVGYTQSRASSGPVVYGGAGVKFRVDSLDMGVEMGALWEDDKTYRFPLLFTIYW